MSSPDSPIRTSTIVIASAGALVTGLLAYAVYFDHKRQTDPQFRRALKKDSKRVARAKKEEAEAQGAEQKAAIQRAMREVEEEGLPQGPDEKEAFFLSQISQGETLAADETKTVEAATYFYKALKVYPAPTDLMSIYDKTCPKSVLDVLADMIAMDPSINQDESSGMGRGSFDP